MNDEFQGCSSVRIGSLSGRPTPRGATSPPAQDGDPEPRPRKSLSQVDMAFDILRKARGPLHISQILERIQTWPSIAKA